MAWVKSAVVTKKVWFDITIDGQSNPRVEIGCFGKIVPKTVENFVKLAAGYKDRTYKNSMFHKIIPGMLIQGGDITGGNGKGCKHRVIR